MTVKKMKKDQKWQSRRNIGKVQIWIYYKRRTEANESNKNADLVHMKRKRSASRYILHGPEERPAPAA